MGADIHMVLEKRINDKWVGLNTFSHATATAVNISLSSGDEYKDDENKYFISWIVRRRNYRLFARLASVRGHGAIPRGLPPDISSLALFMSNQFGKDGHSHSYGMLSEIGSVWISEHAPFLTLDPRRYAEILGLFSAWTYTSRKLTTHTPELCLIELEKFRLVYWFDS